MIGWLLLLQATTGIDGTALGALPPQQLPASGCAAYLWSAGTTHRLVALASAEPAQLRLVLDGKTVDLPRAGQSGPGGFGLAAKTSYRQGDTLATLDLTVETNPNLTGGGTVPSATLTIDRAGLDGIVMPAGGLIGCAPPPK